MIKWIAAALAALVVLVAGALAALPWLVDVPKVQAYISQAATQALGRPVKFASLSVSGFPLPQVRLRGLEVADDPRFGGGPLLTVEEGRVGIRLLPLLSGRVELADLTLDRPRLDIVEEAGRWNLAMLAPPAAPAHGAPRGGGAASAGAAAGPAISRVRIVDGTVRYQRRGARRADLRLEAISLTLAASGRADVVGVTGEALVQPGGVRLRISDGAFTMGVRSIGEMPLKASVEIDARDMADLSAALLPSPQLTGAVKGTLRLSGTPSRLSATGDLGVEHLALSQQHAGCPPPQPRQLLVDELKLPLVLTPARLVSAPLRATLAGGTVSARAELRWPPDRARLMLSDISVKDIELSPVLVDYQCQGYAVSGLLELSGEATLAPADPWRSLQGSGHLRIGKGKVVGPEALALLREVRRLAGLPSPRVDRGGHPVAPEFDTISGSYTVTNGVAETRDLLYQSGGMTLAAVGTYRLSDTRVYAELTLRRGRRQVKATVTGTATPRSLRIVPSAAEGGEPSRRLLEQLLR